MIVRSLAACLCANGPRSFRRRAEASTGRTPGSGRRAGSESLLCSSVQGWFFCAVAPLGRWLPDAGRLSQREGQGAPPSVCGSVLVSRAPARRWRSRRRGRRRRGRGSRRGRASWSSAGRAASLQRLLAELVARRPVVVGSHGLDSNRTARGPLQGAIGDLNRGTMDLASKIRKASIRRRTVERESQTRYDANGSNSWAEESRVGEP
jgi:hypothetical protein